MIKDVIMRQTEARHAYAVGNLTDPNQPEPRKALQDTPQKPPNLCFPALAANPITDSANKSAPFVSARYPHSSHAAAEPRAIGRSVARPPGLRSEVNTNGIPRSTNRK